MSEKKKYPSDAQDQYMVRFPAGMRDRIRLLAEGAGRSMNAEIVLRLQRTLDEDLNEATARGGIFQDPEKHISIQTALEQLLQNTEAIKQKMVAIDDPLGGYVNVEAIRAEEEIRMRGIAERLGFEVRPKGDSSK